ncbi:type I-E CRISPR-associated protein Cas7/Cse4/CasC [Eggerthellaceae bacterium PR-HUZ602407-17]|jgi:hypothetical protein
MENTTSERLFLDIHAIQTVPPANINRDDTGSPKTAQFGGVTRARVSSQCWKHAMRKSFPEDKLGVRTKRALDLFYEHLGDLDENRKYELLFLLESLGFAVKISASDDKGESEKIIIDSVFMWCSNNIKAFINFYLKEKEQITPLAEKYHQEIKEELANPNSNKKRWRKLSKKEKKLQLKLSQDLATKLKDNNSLDINLFGRMLAGNEDLMTDASAQVAHAISTHAIEDEFDFFTAVDEKTIEGQTGAGMIGTIEYNSSTLYRYANIGLHNLHSQLHNKKDVIDSAQLFVDAFVKSMPTGKINSFAHQTLPQAIIVSLRDDRPVNMITAFEKPIKSENGYAAPSIVKLFEEYGKYDKILDKPRFTEYLLLDDFNVANIGGNAAHSLNDLIVDLGAAISSNLKEQREELLEN